MSSQQQETIETISTLSRIFIILVLLVGSFVTAAAIVAFAWPHPPGVFVCIEPIPSMLAIILNFGMPLGILSVGGFIWSGLKLKKLDWFSITMSVVALVSLFSCTMAIWSCLVEGVGSFLWSKIWWGFPFATQ